MAWRALSLKLRYGLSLLGMLSRVFRVVVCGYDRPGNGGTECSRGETRASRERLATGRCVREEDPRAPDDASTDPAPCCPGDSGSRRGVAWPRPPVARATFVRDRRP